MFTSISIVSQPGPELNAIRQVLRNPMRFSLREFHTLNDANVGLAMSAFDVLVMRLGTFSADQLKMVMRARLRFPLAGLVTISSQIDPQARFQTREVSRHILLQDPAELSDLPIVIERLAKGAVSPNRMHSRFMRNGDCEIFDSETGEKIQGSFVDFAQMGARLLVHPRVPLRKNSRIQLHYRSTSEPGRTHRIESKVMWTELKSGIMSTIMRGPEQTIGLRFIAAL